MHIFEIMIGRDYTGGAVVSVLDENLREIVRIDALSHNHARRVAEDCAIILTKIAFATVVLR